MPEPVSESLFDFDFERSDTPLYTDLTKAEVQSLMYAEMLTFRPSSRGEEGSAYV